jgi:hypothetical protein
VALEPFRRKIGIPGAAPLIPVRTIAMPDIGGQIAAAGQSIFAAGRNLSANKKLLKLEKLRLHKQKFVSLMAR